MCIERFHSRDRGFVYFSYEILPYIKQSFPEPINRNSVFGKFNKTLLATSHNEIFLSSVSYCISFIPLTILNYLQN